MALKSIAIRNLRSLANKQQFELCPLVFAVGANSTGKSTFLKVLPLLRQSTEATTKGPILWYGKYVDFGLFDSAVSRGSADEEIEFEFEVEIAKTEGKGSTFGPSLNFLDDGLLKISLTVASSKGLTYTKKLTLELFGRCIQIYSDDEGVVKEVLLDDEPISLGTTKAEITAGNGLFSMALRRKRTIQTPEGNREVWLATYQEGLLPARVLVYVKGLYHGRTSPAKTRYVANRLGIGTSSSFLKQLQSLAANTQTSSEKSLSITENSQWLQELLGYVIVDRIPDLLSELNGMLVRTFAGTRYMGPARAVAQRFYRLQDLAVNEVDQAGDNLPMFLTGLSNTRREEFSDWCADNLGFSLKTKVEGAHVSLLISDGESGEHFNVADMGFGYSQILPLLATLWLGISDARKRSSIGERTKGRRGGFIIPGGGITVIIEQPELHLHPRMQARFADLLISIASISRGQNYDVRIICETHSEVIINRVGNRIAEGLTSQDVAKVYLFEKMENECVDVSLATFDDNGVLLNWPFGFFQP